MRDTRYAREIRSATDSVGQTIERLFIKEHKREEIRFSWWKDGRMVVRPLDLPEEELLPLMKDAVAKGVSSERFLRSLRSALAQYLDNDEPLRSSTNSESIDDPAGEPTSREFASLPGSSGLSRMTAEEILALGGEVAALPLADKRSPNEIIEDLNSL